MTRVKGYDIFIKVNTGTEESPVWTSVGGQSDATFDRGMGMIDTTGKDDSWHETHLPGIKNWGISFDHFLIEDDTGWLKVETSYDERTQLQYQIYTASHTYMGKATVESLSISAPKDGASVVSLSLKGTEGLAKGS